MKNILNFEDHSSYNVFYNDIPINDIDGNYYKPNIISICKNEKDIHFNKKEKIIPINYLQSNGTQYIDTKIIPNANTGAYIKVICSDNTDRYFIGLRNNASTNTRWGIGHSSAGFYWCYNTYQSSNRLTGSSGELWLNFNNSKKFVAVWNSTTKEDSLPSISFTPQYSIWLFGWHGSTNGCWTGGKIYFVQITQGTDLIMDLIPVRVGQVGYMFDKVSGKLYGNSGTGDFILGPDIQPIEYLQSTGVQHINTEYTPNANTQLYIEFSVVSYNTNMLHATTPFGTRIAWQNKQFVLFCPVNNVKQSVVCYGNATQSNTNTTINLNQKYICDVNKTTWLLKHSNGTNIISKTFTATDTSNLPNLHLYLFNLNQNNVISTTNDILNIYKCKIKENDVLIHDLIPVRVGQVGYMYDKVSGKLFGNLGTGSFILGPDI